MSRGEFPEFFLVNYWRLDDVREQRFYEFLELRDPDGAVVGDLKTTPFPLGGRVRRHFNLIRFYRVKLVTAGPHEVRVILRDAAAEAVVTTASVPLQVD